MGVDIECLSARTNIKEQHKPDTKYNTTLTLLKASDLCQVKPLDSVPNFQEVQKTEKHIELFHE